MLEPHPPHHTPNTWRDFFIHIATIVVGLLIAVGLEQTVEAIHHRHQLHEARTQLVEERDLNRKVLELDADLLQQEKDELAQDMIVLHQRASDPSTPLAGKLHYAWYGYATAVGAWQAANQNATAGLMTTDELRLYSYRYDILAIFRDAFLKAGGLMEDAGAIVQRDPAGNLSSTDVQDLVRATSAAQAAVGTVQKFLFFAQKIGLEDKLTDSFANGPRVRVSEMK